MGECFEGLFPPILSFNSLLPLFLLLMLGLLLLLLLLLLESWLLALGEFALIWRLLLLLAGCGLCSCLIRQSLLVPLVCRLLLLLLLLPLDVVPLRLTDLKPLLRPLDKLILALALLEAIEKKIFRRCGNVSFALLTCSRQKSWVRKAVTR